MPRAEWVDLGYLDRSTHWISTNYTVSPQWLTFYDTSGYTTTGSSTTSGGWHQWSSSTSGTLSITYNEDRMYNMRPARPEPLTAQNCRSATPEQVVQAEARIREARIREQMRERADVRTAAEERAAALLESLLSDQQRESYRLNGVFEVIGSAGNVYRISRGVSGNIEWVKPDGNVGARLCAHPEMRHGWLPTPDVMLAQLLALTTDEPSFIRQANVHAGVRPPLAVA